MKRVLWNWPMAVALSWAASELIGRGSDPLPPRTQLLALACCASLSAHALLPAVALRLGARLLLPAAWGAAVMGGAALLRAAVPGPNLWLVALHLMAGVGALTLVLEAATTACAKWLGSRDSALLVVWLAFGLAGSGPLWLGPAVEQVATTSSWASVVAATSPLTFLAVLAKVDYFRTEWFYQHCVFGSLRFAYPSAVSMALSYLGLGAALAVSSGRRTRTATSNLKEDRP